MTQPIYFFKEREGYGYLSNNFYSPFIIDNKKWPTVTHYFEAMKYKGTPYEEQIRLAPTPIHALVLSEKKYVTLHENEKIDAKMYFIRNNTYSYRKDWDMVMLDILKHAIKEKFKQNPHLERKLLKTQSSLLIYNNIYDSQLGIGVNKKGQNILGKLLMAYRDVLLKKNYNKDETRDDAETRDEDEANNEGKTDYKGDKEMDDDDETRDEDETNDDDETRDEDEPSDKDENESNAKDEPSDKDETKEISPIITKEISPIVTKKIPFYSYVKDAFYIVGGVKVQQHEGELIKLGGQLIKNGEIKFWPHLKNDVKAFIESTYTDKEKESIFKRNWIVQRIKFHLDQAVILVHMKNKNNIDVDDIQSVLHELSNCPTKKICKDSKKISLITEIIKENVKAEKIKITEEAVTYLGCSVHRVYKYINKKSENNKESFSQTILSINEEMKKRANRFLKKVGMKPAIANSIIRSLIHISMYFASQLNMSEIDVNIIKKATILFYPQEMHQQVEYYLDQVSNFHKTYDFNKTLEHFSIDVDVTNITDVTIPLHEDVLLVLAAATSQILLHINKNTIYSELLILRSFFYSRNIIYILNIETQLENFKMDAFVYFINTESVVKNIIKKRFPSLNIDNIIKGEYVIKKIEGVHFLIVNPLSSSYGDVFHSLVMSIDHLMKNYKVKNVVIPYKLGDELMSNKKWASLLNDISLITTHPDTRKTLFYVIKDPQQTNLDILLHGRKKSISPCKPQLPPPPPPQVSPPPSQPPPQAPLQEPPPQVPPQAPLQEPPPQVPPPQEPLTQVQKSKELEQLHKLVEDDEEDDNKEDEYFSTYPSPLPKFSPKASSPLSSSTLPSPILPSSILPSSTLPSSSSLNFRDLYPMVQLSLAQKDNGSIMFYASIKGGKKWKKYLSNEWTCDLNIDGVEYPSVSHYYYIQKYTEYDKRNVTKYADELKRFVKWGESCGSDVEKYNAGFMIRMKNNNNWNKFSKEWLKSGGKGDEIMWKGINEKLIQNPSFKEGLKETKNIYLINFRKEKSLRMDNPSYIWGASLLKNMANEECPYKILIESEKSDKILCGENRVGKILMKIRDENQRF